MVIVEDVRVDITSSRMIFGMAKTESDLALTSLYRKLKLHQRSRGFQGQIFWAPKWW